MSNLIFKNARQFPCLQYALILPDIKSVLPGRENLVNCGLPNGAYRLP